MADKYARSVESSYVYSRQSPTEAEKYVATHLPGYHMHEGLSDNHSVVLHNAKNNDVIIAYRGTLNSVKHPLLSIQDYVDDAQIALGLHHLHTLPRQEQAQHKYHRVAATFPNEKIRVAGHSLGGVESYHVATMNNLEGHHFQIGESPLPGVATLHKINSTFHNKNPIYNKQNIYHVENYKALGHIYHGSDGISENTKHLAGTHHTIKKNLRTDFETHDLKHFFVDKKVATAHLRTEKKSEEKIIQSSEAFNSEIKRKKKNKNNVKYK